MADRIEINNISQSIRNALLNRNIGEKGISINTDTLNSPIDLTYSNLTPQDKKRNNYVNYQDYIQDIYGSDSSLINILGAIVDGDSVNLRLTDNGLGIVSDFDIRSSIAGRVVTTATGYDTPLGLFGGKAAGIAMFNGILSRAERVASKTVNNFISKVLGKSTDDYTVYDNSITIDPTKNVSLLGISINADAVNTIEDILGINIDPLEKGKLSSSASIFNEDLDNQRDDISANQYLINSTGKYTRTLIYNTLNRNLYSPGDGLNGVAYTIDNNTLPLLDYKSLYNYLKLPSNDTLEPKNGNSYFTWNNDGLYSAGSDSPSNISTFDTTSDVKFQSNTYINSTLKGKQTAGSRLKTILDKTNELFYSNKIKTIVSNFYDVDLNSDTDITQTAYSKIGDKLLISKGRNLVSENTSNNTNGYNDPYCRVWTWHKQYKTFSDTLRNGNTNDLNSNQNVSPFLINNKKSLLLSQSTLYRHTKDRHTKDRHANLVQIVPYNNSKLKNYMFSIENLAWKGLSQSAKEEQKLTSNEIGPNDGRIMWFPPYDIKFNETSSATIEKNLFIGRGEPIYTYSNTERSGRLTFKLIVDHPSIINYYDAKNPSDTTVDGDENEILRFFAGCGVLNIKSLTPETITTAPAQPAPSTKSPEYETIKLVSIYFPNDYSGVSEGGTGLRGTNSMQYLYSGLGQENTGGGGYENIVGDGLSPVQMGCVLVGIEHNNLVKQILDRSDSEIINYGSDVRQYKRDAIKGNYKSKIKDKNGIYITSYGTNLPRKAYPSYVNFYDIESYGLNSQKGENSYAFRNFYEAVINNNSDYTTINDILLSADSITITGLSDANGYSQDNTILASNRANTVADYIKTVFPNIGTIDIKTQSATATDPCASNKDVKQLRRVDVVVKTKKSDSDTIVPFNQTINPSALNNTVTNTSKSYTLNYSNYESDFFQQKNITDDLVIKQLQKQIKYFHPAFHSMTPEGFNNRLTFLNQCTRQGPTVGGTDPTAQTATNLAFGRPPICVLRIGDFYNTKIIISNLDINYEPLVWDLNPEGVGVQPMIADISLTFNFIGGSDLSGPIARLQNAVTSNFYGNTGLFDNRSDSHSATPDPNNLNYNPLYNPNS